MAPLNLARDVLNPFNDFLKSNYRANGEITAMGIVTYPALPCSPFGPEWARLSSSKLRAILSAMIMSYRYTRSGTLKTLTKGAPPPGWPQEVIPWTNYEGCYRSELYKDDITAIIVALLRGANYDPPLHIEDSSNSPRDDNTDEN